MNTVTLQNGLPMPVIGLGTWKSSSEDAYQAVLDALEAGYRHIDTAMIYGNEEAVGRAIKDSNIPRDELFITTKLWNSDQGYEATLKAFETSLEKLNLDYIDLYLIHWFKGYDKALDSWKAFEELYRNGKVKAIGVSNYNVHHLQYLITHSTIPPMVNQVETHIELQNEFLLDFCKQNNIQLEAYAPFMSWRIKDLLQNDTLHSIAEKHHKTIPQVTIRWMLQRGIVPLPKSVNKKRIVSNIDVFDFELDKDDMDAIKTLNKGNKMFPEYDNVVF